MINNGMSCPRLAWSSCRLGGCEEVPYILVASTGCLISGESMASWWGYKLDTLKIGEMCQSSESSMRLTTYGLAELRIEGDGNCQFRALADQLYHNPDYHKYVRKQIVKQLKHNQKLYEGYVPMEYKPYLKMMKRSGEWGDHVTLQAAADRFEAKVCLLTSFKNTCYVEILPKSGNFSREVWLSFWSEVHYNSLYEVGDVPTRVPRKKYWLF
ncbi:OVARIAN TUMOR DOMAIN-containing deubiquitinating enzyme 11-like isoform X2 [Nymphaea colorata]|uniref:OVARIAN TUMOR DOMAIN-containing deubiquitinating enzyme 11-like isoform X2 n=1 Tax=Nymphaea colorata TaxID=210225 RepID=UPI00129D4BC6|nr:OVARIAN TUMOR DOMAIN-containing deubiquitinating enzyme 11-like isoform X2 [Nymphaea colorata]